MSAVAILPLLSNDGLRPIVALGIDGRPARFQIDTGAETSLLTDSGARRLGLAPGAARRAIAGLGGSASYKIVRIDRVDFGGQTIGGLLLPVVRLAGASGLDGLIGADLLAGYAVDFDFPARLIRLDRVYGCAAVRPPWPAEGLDWIGGRHLPAVPVTLDGQAVTAVLDTGANATAVDSAALGAPPPDIRTDPRADSYGAGELKVAGRLHRFSLLQFGPVAIANPAIRVVDLPPSLGMGMIIGLDVLAGHRLFIDYAGHRAWIGD